MVEYCHVGAEHCQYCPLKCKKKGLQSFRPSKLLQCPPQSPPKGDQFPGNDVPGHATRLVATQQPDKALNFTTSLAGGLCGCQKLQQYIEFWAAGSRWQIQSCTSTASTLSSERLGPGGTSSPARSHRVLHISVHSPISFAWPTPVASAGLYRDVHGNFHAQGIAGAWSIHLRSPSLSGNQMLSEPLESDVACMHRHNGSHQPINGLCEIGCTLPMSGMPSSSCCSLLCES